MSSPMDAMNTSKSLNSILYTLQRLAEPNGLITSDIEWARQAIVEAVEGLIPKVSDLDSPLQQSWKLGGTDEESFRRGYLQAVTSIRQAIKEWQDYGDSK